MWRIIFSLVALIVVGDALAQSQRPSTRSREQRQNQPDSPQPSPAQPSPAQPSPIQQNPSQPITSPPTSPPADPQPSVQPPITVNVLPRPKTDAERADETQARQEVAELNRKLAEFSAGVFYAAVGLAATLIFLVITAGGLGIFAFIRSRNVKASIASANALASESNRIAMVNSQQQLRAYLTARDLTVVIERDFSATRATGDSIEGRVNAYAFAANLKNGGQTPATHIEINVSCRKFHRTIPDGFQFPDSELFGYGLIGPQDELLTPFVRIPATDFAAPPLEGNWFFWGWVEYNDIFNGTSRHRTEFCFAIERNRLQSQTDLAITFKPHSRFNAADRHCLRSVHSADSRSGSEKGSAAGT